MSQVTWKSLPLQNYQGRPHYAYEGPEATLLIEPRSGSYAAQMKGGKLTSAGIRRSTSITGRCGSARAGRRRTRSPTTQTTRRRTCALGTTVEDQQTVHVPAGSFKTFRILYSTDTVWGHIWWSPELGITVKSRLERISSDPAGVGVRESDLLRQSLK
jgi:hypothetical protein